MQDTVILMSLVDPFVPKPQPIRRPAVDLMDNDLPPSSDSPLQSPLLPTPSQPSPSQTNGIKKPNSNVIFLAQNTNSSVPSKRLQSSL